nr:hypothetical protein [Tanacetum cinerariifolium]
MFINLQDLRTLIILTRFTKWSRHFMVYIKLLELGELTFFFGLQVKQKKDGIFISQYKYVAKILWKFGLIVGKSASTPIDTEKPLLKDPDVCACAHFQVTPKASHFDAVKRIFRYLKGKLHLGLWYPKDSRFNLVAYSDSDYARTSVDRKSTTGGCQFLRCRLISWQCKKQTIVATSPIDAEYVAAACCCVQVLWIQNQLLDYGPDQKVSGIDSSNPLMANNSPKIVWYSTHHVALMKSWLVQKQTALGVNTPRCDEDRLELMELTVFLLPSDEKVRIEVCTVDLQNSVVVKKVNDIMRLQALVDKKRVIIMEATIRDALRLDDAEGDLSSHTIKYSSPALTQKVFANISRVGKGCSGVETPLFDGMIVEQPVGEGADEVQDEGVRVVGVAAEGDVSAADDVVPTVVEEPSIPSPKPPNRPPQPSQDIPSTFQGRKAKSQAQIYQIDLEHADKVLSMQDDKVEPVELKEVVEVVTTAKLITEVVIAASTTITDAALQLTTDAAPTLTTAPSAARRRKGVVIRDPEETATLSTIIHSKAKSKDKGKGILAEEPKPLKKQAQIEQDKAYAREFEA